jgi:protein-L-isoaspartate(D-aspartate) O-methyltransferase
MTDLLDFGPDEAVIEIGTGLGYQSAVLAQLACKTAGNWSLRPGPA